MSSSTTDLSRSGDLPSRRSVEVQGTRLSYVEAGACDAECVVMLHGYVGSHRAWRHLIGPLSERYRVIALDWFGWGESGRNLDLDLSYEAELARLVRVLDVLGAERCNFFGHDYGGFLGIGLAVHHPEKLRRLALLNTRAQRTFNRRWRAIFGAISLAARLPLLRLALMLLPIQTLHRVLLRSERRQGIIDPQSLDDYLGWIQGWHHRHYYAHLMAQYRVAVRPELKAGLGDIDIPVAIVWGARDRYLPTEIARELAREIDNARLELIEEAGHFVMEECPKRTLKALRALLERE